MKPGDDTKKSLFIAVATLLFAAAGLVSWRMTPAKTIPQPQPVPLGTNELKMGANLYAPSNSYHFGMVVELDRWHEFPDGSTRPGALLRATNGFKTWTPLEKMGGMMVVQ